jgi:excisionase family DNA binding protein
MGLDSLPEIVTVKQLADFLQISEQTVIRAIKSKKLEAFKIARDWRIEKEAVMKWAKKK